MRAQPLFSIFYSTHILNLGRYDQKLRIPAQNRNIIKNIKIIKLFSNLILIKNMMHNHNSKTSSTFAMIFIMFLAGLFATMNIYANSISDIRFSLNDIYMSIFMVGWMMLFMGIYSAATTHIWIGIAIIVLGSFCIRTQLFITPNQYFTGMIPHHSMAVFMSQKLLENHSGSLDKAQYELVNNIIETQKKEIGIFKE